MVPENPTLEQLEAEFNNDKFATHAAHCKIIEGNKGHSVCEMPIEDIHRNAMGNVMGGAIFTLADFALAIAGNVGQPPTVSVTHSIDFFRSSKGTKLIATAHCDKAGSRLAFFTVDITDDLGKDIARMTATCARVQPIQSQNREALFLVQPQRARVYNLYTRIKSKYSNANHLIQPN